MNFALYIMSAAISILLYLYIVSKNLSNSSLFVVTEVDGGSILCAEYGRTYTVCTKCDTRKMVTTCLNTFQAQPPDTSIVISSLADANCLMGV